MLGRLFPPAFDNHYQGKTAALWIFGLILALKILQSVNVMFQPYYIAISADGIPLPSYSSSAVATIVGLFSLLGLAQFMLWTIGVLALVRYRSMVPLMFCAMVLHYFVGRGLLLLHPIERTGPHAGIYINMAAFVLMLVGLLLSLTRKGGSVAQSTVA